MKTCGPSRSGQSGRGPRRRGPGPARYPAPEFSFAGYPSACLTDADRVQAMPDAEALLDPVPPD